MKPKRLYGLSEKKIVVLKQVPLPDSACSAIHLAAWSLERDLVAALGIDEAVLLVLAVSKSGCYLVHELTRG